MIYLTYNDQVNGIFSGQVVDVVKYFREDFSLPVRLISFFPGSLYAKEKIKLKNLAPWAIPIKAFFPLRVFRFNRSLIYRHLNFPGFNGIVVARGVFAASIALSLKKRGMVKKVVYDGRGAVSFEFKEYNMGNSSLAKMAARLERKAVRESDFRIAVSEKLIEYWKDNFEYSEENHIVVPTTLDTQRFSAKAESGNREKFGFGQKDKIFVFVGGNADWQSPDLLLKFALEVLPKVENGKLLLLSQREFPQIENHPELKGLVVRKALSPEEVFPALKMADFGLLLREKSVTNKVSSPTKFAEYLSAGLPVLISPGVGDFSEMVREHSLGWVWEPGQSNLPEFARFVGSEVLQAFAGEHFMKNSEVVKDAYSQMLKSLCV